MYDFTIYRGAKGADPNDLKSLMTLTTEYESVARLVERLKAQNPEYDYYFVRKSGFISRHDDCKRTIKQAYENNLAEPWERNRDYIAALRNGLLIGDHEAEQLHAYNAACAASYEQVTSKLRGRADVRSKRKRLQGH